MIRIAHVISGLETGGAELFLERLVGLLGGGEFEHQVVSMRTVGPTGERLRQSGVRVDALHSRSGGGLPFGLFKLGRLLRSSRPDLIQGWLYHGNLGAWAGLRLSRLQRPLLWNVRHSLDGWREESWQLRAGVHCSGWLARAPQRIIFNSSRAALQHGRLGYPQANAVVIPNGFDVEKFAPNAAERASTRCQLGIGTDELVLGMVGRYHPLKDHANFLRAARIVADAQPDARFVLVGRQVVAENRTLMSLVRELQLQDRVMLLGERTDVPDLLNAMDIYVSSSSSEAFPNAVGEAMSCAVPCVVTDAGDSAELVADTGVLVPPKSPERLAEGMLQLIRAGADRRQALGAAARERIRLKYSNEKIAQLYADLYRSVYKSTHL